MDSRLRGNDEIAPNRNLSNVFVALLVAVDVGHYAAEPGVISASGRAEFEYNRDLAFDLRTELQRMGLRVQLIGERGDYAVLHHRTRDARGAGFAPSRYHADPVLGESRPFADEPNGVHFYDNLAVGRSAAMAAVLLEAGVIVNRDEERMMRDPENRRGIAVAVAEGVRECLAKEE